MKPTTSPTPWRCRSCGALLGVAQDGQVELRRKDASYGVRGRITTRCRRCGAANEFVTPDQPVREGDRADS